MKIQRIGALASFLAAAVAKEIKPDLQRGAELYDSGIMHEHLMSLKMEHWAAEKAAGIMDSSVWPRLNYTQCINGKAEAIPGDPLHTFKCKNADLYDFLPHAAIGSPIGNSAGEVGSSAWGWTDEESGREFIAAGLFQGASFIEILPTGKMRHVGFLPTFGTLSENSLWREIRGYKHYMLIGSEQNGHGVQIFDMKKLLDITDEQAPRQFAQSEVTGHFTELPIGATHNVVSNDEMEYGVAVGARPRTDACRGGLIFFDLKDPSNPKKLGCHADDGYVHDAQCLVYRGPDKRYEGRDICYGYNEDTLTIYDVTDKTKTNIISRTGYEGSSYTHQGWVLDKNNQEYLLMDDEYDEYDAIPGPGQDGFAATYIWDIKDLENPKQTGVYKATVRGIDHNQYVVDGYSYQSSYINGFRVYDVSSIPSDPTGAGVCETAFFDIYPEDDSAPGGGVLQFSGSWASYAYFKSGYIFINSIERGAFVVKLNKKERCNNKATCSADNCLRAMRSTSVAGRLEESQEFCGEFTKTHVYDVAVVPEFASKACGENVISRVSSACACLPTPTAAA
ncbi:hypothetical protein MCOR25_006719 [Pyricularia grisea]|uniref:Uncharacterized protein n=1 Tax=Pyricularia grisea TaxID=148305 RepID=A0A6P8APU5_PYRGI|nr:hypothetical protein PgNI_11364 [Pyricularia grisea]KAI6360556.1 hypothetical protein MCOR25_006719 [Pyricularia grisea]TLD04043.1 hypothetical protein PgNI_11364 [Pyricularia grisea]